MFFHLLESLTVFRTFWGVFMKLAHLFACPPLNHFSFTLPGFGKSKDYCMKQKVSAFDFEDPAIKFNRMKCHDPRCPNCYQYWRDQIIFQNTFRIEAYSKVTGERPRDIVTSVDVSISRKWDDEDLAKFREKAHRELKKYGKTAGISYLHPYSMRKDVEKKLRKIKPGKSNAWELIRKDVFNYGDWHLYLFYDMHIHNLTFPSHATPPAKSGDIIFKKGDELTTQRDVIRYLYYLTSHVGYRNNEKSQPITLFGDLKMFRPEDYLTPLEINDLKLSIAEDMGKKYERIKDVVVAKDNEEIRPTHKAVKKMIGMLKSKSFSIGNSETGGKSQYGLHDVYDPESDDLEDVFDEFEQGKHTWTSIRCFSKYQPIDFINESYQKLWKTKEASHREFFHDIIKLFNEREDDHSLSKKYRHVFIEDMPPLPEHVAVVGADANEIQKQYVAPCLSGLRASCFL